MQYECRCVKTLWKKATAGKVKIKLPKIKVNQPAMITNGQEPCTLGVQIQEATHHVLHHSQTNGQGIDNHELVAARPISCQ